jgi:hypothetical protein
MKEGDSKGFWCWCKSDILKNTEDPYVSETGSVSALR